jgi:hypothetical protein
VAFPKHELRSNKKAPPQPKAETGQSERVRGSYAETGLSRFSGEASAPETRFKVEDSGNAVGLNEARRPEAAQDTLPGTNLGCPLRAAERQMWIKAIGRYLLEQSETTTGKVPVFVFQQVMDGND